MKYSGFNDVDTARSELPYSFVLPDEVMSSVGLSRGGGLIRWQDEHTDLLAIMYSGSSHDGDGVEHFNRHVFLFMGHGEKCDEPVDGAPDEQFGSVSFGDERVASWAIGTSDRGWQNRKAAWVAWPGLHGDSTIRIVSQDFGISKLRELAVGVAAAES